MASNYNLSLETESYNPSPGGYLFTINDTTDQAQPFLDTSNLHGYRSGEDGSIGSLSPNSASSASPGWFTDSDEFAEYGNPPTIDALTDAGFMKYLDLDLDPLPPDLTSDPSPINMSAPSFPSEQPLFSPLSPFHVAPKYFANASMGYRIPIQGTSNSPSLTNTALSHESNGGNNTAAHHLSLPLSDHSALRRKSAPPPWQERPFMNFNQRDTFSDVFHPDSPDSPPTQSVVLDQLWDGFTLDGVPLSETGIVSLGPRHQVPERGFLAAPKPAHGRRRSDGGVMHPFDDLSYLRLLPQTAPASFGTFKEAASMAPKHSPQVTSLSFPPATTAGGDLAWEGLSSSQATFTGSSGTLNPNSTGGFEDESRPQAADAERRWRPARIVKRQVTTSAVRIASNARKRSHARFACHLCPQSLTTKGGLRNHVNSHIGLKRFQCSEPDCKKFFTTKWVCTRHERTVHGLPI